MLLWKHPLFEGVTHWQQPVCCSWWISVIFIRSISVRFTCWISVACVIFNCCGFCLFGAWPSFCDMTGRGTACDVRTWLPYSTAHHRLWDVKTSKPWWSNQKSITSLLVQDVLYKFLSLKVYSDIFIKTVCKHRKNCKCYPVSPCQPICTSPYRPYRRPSCGLLHCVCVIHHGWQKLPAFWGPQKIPQSFRTTRIWKEKMPCLYTFATKT